MTDNYFIKDGYKINQIVETMDHLSGGIYWSKKRIDQAFLYQYPVYKYLVEFMRRTSLKHLVDVGCGVGPKLQMIRKKLPDSEITGVDQEAAIAYCKETYDFGTWVTDDFENPQNLAEIKSPDVIVSADVIEHLANPDRLLDYLKAIADSDTYILLSTPERDRIRGKACMESPQTAHVREWNGEEFARYLSHRGFNILKHFHVPQFRVSFQMDFVLQELGRIRRRLPRKNNQVVLMRVGCN